MEHHQPRTTKLHIFFFPFMSHGNSIPMIDMAKLFALRGLKSTIVTTPLNAPALSKTLETSRKPLVDIDILTIKFDSVQAGLPEGCESYDSAPSPEIKQKFFKSTMILDKNLEQLIKDHSPDCLVSSSFFPWTAQVAARVGIPRIVFHGTGFFASCATHCVGFYEPHKAVSSDSELFAIPRLPGKIEMVRTQIPDFVKYESEFGEFYKQCKDSEVGSFGVVVNSFYELEPDYVDFYRDVLGRKAWHISPVSIQPDRRKPGEEDSACLQWLDSRKPDSVIYLCFGSVAEFSRRQLLEIAMGLEASGQCFIWVVRKHRDDDGGWLPEGFEERSEGKGMVIRGWAPQVLILNHITVGGFVTHCGWNSTLEGVSSGKAMVTWPVSAEQFYNEKLITEVLRIGVGVGVRRWARLVGDFVGKEMVERAVRKVMECGGEEMRGRAKELGAMARRAVEDGGSAFSDINALIEQLRLQKLVHLRCQKNL